MSAPFAAFSPGLARFGDFAVSLSVEPGRTQLPLREVLALGEGSVVDLSRLSDEPLDGAANGKVIARGEVVAENGRFALRIVSLVGDDDPGLARSAATDPLATPMPPVFDAGSAP